MQPNSSLMRFSPLDLLPVTRTFIAQTKSHIAGTVSAVTRSAAGMPSHGLFEDCFRALEDRGRNVCEGTKFAADDAHDRGMRHVCPKLVKWAFNWCKISKIDDFTMIVHPQHVDFWVKILSFEVLSDLRDCPYVRHNPGVFIRLDIRGILEGTKTLTKPGRKIYVDNPVDASPFLKPFPLSDEEAMVLFVLNPWLITTSSPQERVALYQHYPQAMEDLQLSPKNVDTQLAHHNQAKRTRVRIFRIRTFLNNVFSLLTLIARERGVFCDFRVDDAVPHDVAHEMPKLTALIENTMRYIVSRARSNEHIRLHVSLASKDVTKATLLFQVSSVEQQGLSNNADQQVFKPATNSTSFYPHTKSKVFQSILSAIRVLGEKIAVMQKPGTTPALAFTLGAETVTTSIHHVAATTQEQTKFQRSGPALQILVVDDDIATRRLTRRVFERYGHNIVEAHNGAEAVQYTEKQDFDIIFMDCQMPVLSGFEATKQIRMREKENRQHTHIVALTAFTLDSDRERCFAAGMDAYLAKPISINNLLKAVEKVAHDKVVDPIEIPARQDRSYA